MSLIRAALLGATAALVATPAVAADPAPTKAECIAASESGQDLRHAGKLRDARTQFAVCVAASCPGPIRSDCAQQLDEVGKAIPSVVFDVTDVDGNDLPGVTIMMDGRAVAASDAALELDPGEHLFTFEAPGLKKTEDRLVIVEGVKRRREVIIMDRADVAADGSTASPAPGEAPARSAGPRTAAWVAFGVGGAGLTLGVVAGLVANGKHSTLAAECNGNTSTCAPRYSGDLDEFHTWRTISTVGYVVGALGIASGAVVWLATSRSRSETVVGLRVGPASAAFVGSF